ncbi:hypothetical protein KC730_01990, partial [Candidatus Kaiserbacteria bacterium]|nr:hypothetical protein [Candidatus Kaiserbacteria bacterium]
MNSSNNMTTDKVDFTLIPCLSVIPSSREELTEQVHEYMYDGFVFPVTFCTKEDRVYSEGGGISISIIDHMFLFTEAMSASIASRIISGEGNEVVKYIAREDRHILDVNGHSDLALVHGTFNMPQINAWL